MRNVFVLFCLSVVFLLLVSACGTESDASDQTDSAVELGEEFIHELYNVDDPSQDYDDMSAASLIAAQEEFSAYFTEEEFAELESKRFFLIPLETASVKNSTMTVQNIEFEKSDREGADSDSLDLEHSFTLLFEDLEGKEEEVEINGQMTVVDTEDGLKIDRYHVPVEKLLP